MFNELSFMALMQKGGITVIILAVFSIISIAVMLERAWTFRNFKSRLRASHGTLRVSLRGARPGALQEICSNDGSALASVVAAGFIKRQQGRDEVLRAMELTGRAEIARLEKNLGVLGTIGSTAPFIGLFGTVLGIIRAFGDLATSHGAAVGANIAASPAAVADGIAEALVATATGLFVAVPAVMAYNYFVRTSAGCALDLETKASDFTDVILAEGTAKE